MIPSKALPAPFSSLDQNGQQVLDPDPVVDPDHAIGDQPFRSTFIR